MTNIPRGLTTTLIAEFHEYPGGPPTDILNLTLEVVNMSSGDVVLGPVDTGFLHPATGLYAYDWAVPGDLPTGTYVAVWNGTDVSLTPVQASELFTVTAPSALVNGPCEDWEPIWCEELPTGAEAVTGNAVTMATEVLWQAAGQRFGLCTVTLRPCRDDCASGWTGFNDWWPGVGSTVNGSGGGPRPWWYNGTWYNVCSAGCDSCSCTMLGTALLPAPTREVIQVMLDGSVMDPSGYRVDENRKLVRIDGAMWPLCQDLTRDDTQPGTWSVTITVGEDVPLLAQRALGQLAMVFVKECLGEDCLLPWDVTSISRQGVNLTFGNTGDMRDILGQLGLRFVDLFIATYNPNRLQGRGKVYDVDRNPRPWRRVDTS
jgi:hypothetical protein